MDGQVFLQDRPSEVPYGPWSLQFFGDSPQQAYPTSNVLPRNTKLP